MEKPWKRLKKALPVLRRKMDAFSIAYFCFAKEYPAHFEVMFNSLLEAGAGAAAESGPVFTMLTETIRAAQQRGEVRLGDSALLARVAWALVHGASMLQRDSAELQFIRFSNEVLRSGLNDGHGPSISPQATSPPSKSGERNA